MVPSSYQRLEFTIPLEQIDSAVEICWEMSTTGLTEETICGKTNIEAFFPETDVEVQKQFLRTARAYGLKPIGIRCTVVPNDTASWLSKWKESFPSFAVTEKIFIHPSWKAPSAVHPINIRLEPGHGFGSGTHESTQLVLEALEAHVGDFTSLVDLGTGSGILSIAASKLKPGLRVFAFDNDPQAVDAARENFLRNGLRDINLFAGTADTLKRGADLVVANLTLGTFQQTAREILRLTRSRLIISGLTEDQEEAAWSCFKRVSPMIQKIQRWSRNGWRCLLLGF